MKKTDVVIIGSGPAGLFAAKAFRNTNIDVILLEATDKVAQKLLISGAGQCNYTNIINTKDFYDKYGDNGRFLKKALYHLNNEDTIDYFLSMGIDKFVNDIGKVFPSTLKSSDILEIILRDCSSKNISIKKNSRVTKLEKVGDRFVVRGEGFGYECSQVILACGGNSYQHTGSKGDGVKLAASLGCSIVDIKPALAPVFIEGYSFSGLSGISFKDIVISQYRQGKKLRDFRGDLLFTHRNLSGPVILNNSRYFELGDELHINFTNVSADSFRTTIVDSINNSGKLNLKTVLVRELDYLPKRFIEAILDVSNIDEDTRCGDLKKSDRQAIIRNLTAYRGVVNKLGDFKNAMVTKGGISLTAINKNTMESKEVDGLYFAGEVMDIDGDTGGFNIQAAFSTGNLAAKSIIQRYNRS